jgi:hypothetical protein
MKKLLSLIAMTFSIGLATVAGLARPDRLDSGCSTGLEDQWIGAWRLAWLEEPDASGRIHKADSTGMLVFTRDGHMSVQVMYREPQAGGEAGPVRYAVGGYEASFGVYKIDESAHSFTFHVEGTMVRNLIGRDLVRAFELSGRQLVVRSADATEHWRAVWERY